jgi:hypothetical protein
MKRTIEKLAYMTLGIGLLGFGCSKFFAFREYGWYSALDLLAILIGATIFLVNVVRFRQS